VTKAALHEPQRGRGRLWLFLGAGLAVLGVAVYVVQISLGRLAIPWYMPALAIVGSVLVVISLVQRRTLWRAVAVVVVGLLASAQVAFLLMVRLPPYTGPIAVGQPFPAFETSRASGASFGQRDLAGDRKNVLIFFRGRW
jgi:hypothetical protein